MLWAILIVVVWLHFYVYRLASTTTDNLTKALDDLRARMDAMEERLLAAQERIAKIVSEDLRNELKLTRLYVEHLAGSPAAQDRRRSSGT